MYGFGNLLEYLSSAILLAIPNKCSRDSLSTWFPSQIRISVWWSNNNTESDCIARSSSGNCKGNWLKSLSRGKGGEKGGENTNWNDVVGLDFEESGDEEAERIREGEVNKKIARKINVVGVLEDGTEEGAASQQK